MQSPEPPGGYEAIWRVLEGLHVRIRQTVRQLICSQKADELAREIRPGAGDVSFQIDLPAEELILETFERARHVHPIVVTAEGIGEHVFPDGARAEDAPLRVLIDPIDGSRELAYQRRSAWIESGVAHNRNGQTTLSDIAVTMLTEIPPSRQQIGVVARAVRGHGASERAWDLVRDEPLGKETRLQSSQARTIRGGFATFVHFYPGTHAIAGQLADRVFEQVLGPTKPGEAAAFDDQYHSTAGLLYLLASGRQRLCADLRPEVGAVLAREGREAGLCAHPYDLSCALIAEEAGVVLTDGIGGSLAYPLDTATNCSWLGYANGRIYHEVAGILQAEVRRLVDGS